MSRVILVLAGLAGPLLGACFPTQTVRASFDEFAADRAAFEMQCPKNQLQLTRLNSSLDEDARIGAQVGVTACGKRVVYVLVLGAGWVVDSAFVEKPQGNAQPSPT